MAVQTGSSALLTPVLKGFQTDKGFEMAVQAQQIWGGHGYIEEQGMSSSSATPASPRSTKAPTAVQALDLVGRKLAQDGGKHVMAFFDLVKTFIKENEGDDGLKTAFLVDPLEGRVQRPANCRDVLSCKMHEEPQCRPRRVL